MSFSETLGDQWFDQEKLMICWWWHISLKQLYISNSLNFYFHWSDKWIVSEENLNLKILTDIKDIINVLNTYQYPLDLTCKYHVANKNYFHVKLLLQQLNYNLIIFLFLQTNSKFINTMFTTWCIYRHRWCYIELLLHWWRVSWCHWRSFSVNWINRWYIYET